MGDLFCRHNQFALNFTHAFEVKLDKFGGNSAVFYLNNLIAGFDLSEI